jgi:hypothetical protein
MKLFRSCLLVCLFLTGIPTTWACSCFLRPACFAYSTTDSLFVGQVMEIVDQDKPNPQGQIAYTVAPLLVRFRVQERFRGATDNIVEVSTGRGGGDCGYPFKVGETYLVYAYKAGNSGTLRTGICSRTRSLEKASDDLEFLRSLPNQPPGATIFGKVTLHEESSKGWQSTPMAGIQVSINGPTTSKAITDATGSYNFHSLPPGSYDVNFTLAEGYMGHPSKVTVADKTCAEVNEYPRPAGEISGRVLDANSKPVANVVVDLRYDSKPRESWARPYFNFAQTDQDGHYKFQELPPGTYVAGVNIVFAPEHKAPFNPTYYPGLKEDTQPIYLGFGQRFTKADIQLPPRLVEREVPVVVMWPDGRKVEGAKLTITDSTDLDYHFGPQKSEQNPDAILLFEGEKYYVGAFVNRSDGKQQCAEALEVLPSAHTEPVKLVINHDGGLCSSPKRK